MQLKRQASSRQAVQCWHGSSAAAAPLVPLARVVAPAHSIPNHSLVIGLLENWSRGTCPGTNWGGEEQMASDDAGRQD